MTREPIAKPYVTKGNMNTPIHNIPDCNVKCLAWTNAMAWGKMEANPVRAFCHSL